MIFRRYMHWLHTRWPAGTVEKLPEVREDGTTAVPGVRVVGDLAGVPLLKFAADTGARAVQAILAEADFQRASAPESHSVTESRSVDQGNAGTEVDVDVETVDLAIVGGGVAGMAAALEAKKAGLRFVVFEAAQPFATIADFPKAKPIFTYPTDMTPAGDMQFTADVKESLLEELERQRVEAGIEPRVARVERLVRRGDGILVHHEGGPTRARRVIVAIGRSGNYRKLGALGEELPKVHNRLHDPTAFTGMNVLVVGGGDSALEAAIAIANAGGKVTLSYRRPSFSRAKPKNVARADEVAGVSHSAGAADAPSVAGVAGSLRFALGTQVTKIREDAVDLKDASGNVSTVVNNVVFTMIGREPPLDFFRRSGIPIRGEWRAKQYIGFSLFAIFCLFLYHWKSDATFPFTHFSVKHWFHDRGWFPFNVGAVIDRVFASASDRTSFVYTLKGSMGSPSFYYTFAYSALVVIFGIRRIRRRKTPYVKWQTLSLMAVQCIPLFILPQLLLPWAGRNGAFEQGTTLGAVADQFFEPYDMPSAEALAEAGVNNVSQWPKPIGRERAYWRAYGFILAWPLFVANFFTDKPMVGWLILGSLQTFVLIPLMVRRWGKGAYCGWICSCGGLAETLGDTHRHKMPHGPKWNRLNMVGQGLLAFAAILMGLRVIAWIAPGSFAGGAYVYLYDKLPVLNYRWFVDLMLAGFVGVACYFWFSGRVWCRFACPLAALMHIYARFSRFRIFADKKKCISCNVCTSVCHQGIDIMNFANKGKPMQDPECVRCSACVHSCPTGVLTFGRYNAAGQPVPDRLAASPVQMAEARGSLVSLPVVSG